MGPMSEKPPTRYELAFAMRSAKDGSFTDITQFCHSFGGALLLSSMIALTVAIAASRASFSW